MSERDKERRADPLASLEVGGVTLHVCDHPGFSSFEEQWGHQLGLAQEAQADQDFLDDLREENRLLACELLEQGPPDDPIDAELIDEHTEEVEPDELDLYFERVYPSADGAETGWTDEQEMEEEDHECED